MNTLRLSSLVLLTAMFLAACSSGPQPPQAPEIVYGQDVCDSCGMIIDDARFAAATILKDGGSRKFDDVADMAAYHMDHPNEQVLAWFVHDPVGEYWIRGEPAYFVTGDFMSPMGGSVAAFEDPSAARAFATEMGGQVLNFDEFRMYVHEHVHGQ
jgi:copper chaperone NosL